MWSFTPWTDAGARNVTTWPPAERIGGQNRAGMDRWWRRTDGEPGLSWPAAILLGLAWAVGGLIWVVVTDDGPLDGDLVGAGGSGLLLVVLARVDIKERVRRRGNRHSGGPEA